MKKDWEIKKLGEVCEIRPSKNETIKFLKDDDNVTFFPMEDLQILNYYIEPKQLKKLKEISGSYTCFANGDVLLAKVTPCFENGKLGIANNLENGVGFGSSEYIVFRPSNILLSEYLYYCLASPNFRENGKKHLLGACGLKRLSKDYVNEYEIPIPPLEEQKRIVKILDEKFAQLESLKANAQTNLQNVKDLFQSQLSQAFEQKDCHTDSGLLTQSQKKDFKDFPLGKSNPCGNKWKTVRLDDVCEIRPPKSETTKYLNDDANVSFLPMEDLQIMNYYIEPKQSKKLKEVSGSYTCFANGDVLLAKVTPCFENGKQGIAKDLTNGVGFGSSEYIVFRPASELLSEYLYYSLATSDFRENGKKHLIGACGLKRLSKDYVNEYKIPLPPLPEQKRIVKELDTLSKKVKALQNIYEKMLLDCEELKQAYLQKAFEGELD